PACPDHTEKWTLWKLLNVEAEIGLKLTENLAMTPASSVSGYYFASPESKYFMVGPMGRDQIEAYAQKKNMTVPEVEKWLSSNLGYRS
ncbi:MAG: hypothetical protein KDD22_04975, partial [Bdellovibrionales bacterium]|nr:hypothetical protein [Bdellovibrionales bacterium]